MSSVTYTFPAEIPPTAYETLLNVYADNSIGGLEQIVNDQHEVVGLSFGDITSTTQVFLAAARDHAKVHGEITVAVIPDFNAMEEAVRQSYDHTGEITAEEHLGWV